MAQTDLGEPAHERLLIGGKADVTRRARDVC